MGDGEHDVKIWQYLGVTPSQFQTNYVETGLVDVACHPEFPLELLSYGREAVHTNNWDPVIRKCRGIIFNALTQEVVSRPFEKFFNLGSANMPETQPDSEEFKRWWTLKQPEVWEKMDGFLCTMYEYEGKQYIASKGSFNSSHAKWATAWYQKNVRGEWPKGYTPVFEGICSAIRIVVDYEDFEGLVLLALVKVETGEELNQSLLRDYAFVNGVETPHIYSLTWQGASKKSLDTEAENFEGYVLVWRREGQTPFRLKVKYVDYLRLHRMVSGVSAKAIYRGLSDPAYAGDLDEWCNESTPWFSKFVNKWVKALTTRYAELLARATTVYDSTEGLRLLNKGFVSLGEIRKLHAEEFKKYPEVKGILFAMLDGKDVSAVAWKLVKPLVKGSHPMIDASKM